MQGAVRAVIAQRRLQLLVAQIQAGKLEPKSLIQTQDNGIRWALWHPCFHGAGRGMRCCGLIITAGAKECEQWRLMQLTKPRQ